MTRSELVEMLIEDGHSQTNLRKEESKERVHVANSWLRTPDRHKVKWSEIFTVVYLTWRIFPGVEELPWVFSGFNLCSRIRSNAESHRTDQAQLMKSDNKHVNLAQESQVKNWHTRGQATADRAPAEPHRAAVTAPVTPDTWRMLF